MDLLVNFKGILTDENLAAIITTELRPGRMGHLVGLQSAGAVKTLTTLCAVVALLVFVHFFMGSEMGGSNKAFTALTTMVRSLHRVRSLVDLQGRHVSKSLLALRALVVSFV